MIRIAGMLILLIPGGRSLAAELPVGAAPPVQASREQLARAMAGAGLEHPYLLFSGGEKAALLERIRSNPECRDIMKEVRAQGNRFLRMPFDRKALQEPEHPRFVAENKAYAYRSEISAGALTLAFLYQVTGDVAYARRASEFAAALCDISDWTHVVHRFDIIYPRVWPWNVPDDQVVFSFDLNAARIAQLLSLVYDWLYPALTTPERDRIRGALLEKAITRVRGNYDFFWWSTAYRCNWSAVCYSGLGFTALALAGEHPQLLDVAAESFNRMQLTFDQIGPEGGWQEGRSYFSYMLERSCFFMEALRRVTGGRFNLFHHPAIKAHAFDFEMFSLTAPFGDGGGAPVGPTYLVNKLVTETGSGTTAWYREHLLGAGGDIFDIVWPRSSVKPVAPRQQSVLFTNIGWAILRSDLLDQATVTIACKAGFNDDPHHGHLDCGQFTLTWQGVPFIRDLGRMEYDEHYFNDERFDYPHASSQGHNLISVNGEEQIPAKHKNRPWKEGVGGTVLAFRTGEKRDVVLMDPSRAYPGKELRRWRRSIVLEKPVVTLLLDEVHTAVGAEIRSRFYPGVGVSDLPDAPSGAGHRRRNRGGSGVRQDAGDCRVMSDHVFLRDDAGHAMALVPLVLGDSCSLGMDRLAAMPVTEEARVTWLPYIETSTKAATTATVLATIILPAVDEGDAQRIARSASVRAPNATTVEVRVRPADRDVSWIFHREREGYVLQSD